ncbi:MAG: transcriptional regulator [Rhodospirillaceae bacterium]|nr:transcriptional regulator [Rhodospirillaceae bacterium]|tara:strand:- start:11 stop:916 length:906 start_codon:yes stop_codon:yes gene_type:complete
MNYRLPPLNALRAFESAARHLSFKRAAEELNVTPAAISHQIKGLEADLGMPLFRRLNRALLLTDEGQLLLPDIRDGFQSFHRAIERLRARSSENVLTVAMAPSFAAKWLVPRLEKFNRAHPELDVRISASMQMVDYDAEGVDIGIRFGKGNYPGFVSELLLQDTAFPVCSPRLLEGEHALNSPDELRFHVLLHDESWRLNYESFPNWSMWIAAANIEGVDATRGTRFNMTSDVINAAIEGAGVALGRSSMVEGDLEAGRLVKPFDLDVPVEFAFFVVYREANLQQMKVSAFRDWLREEVSL